MARLRNRPRRPRPRPSQGNGGGQRHRPLRPDAWRDASRRRRQGSPSLHPVERRALGGRGTRAQPGRRAHHRQHRLPRLHRAQAPLGEASRAGGLRPGQDGSAAEGLCPAAAHRRQGKRDVGLGRHLVARHRQTPMVRRDAGTHRPRPVEHARAVRGERGDRQAQGGAGAPLGHAGSVVVAGGGGTMPPRAAASARWRREPASSRSAPPA